MSRRGQGLRRGHSEDGWEDWGGGYREAKQHKLKEQFESAKPIQLERENSSGTKIFAGIVIHVNGYTKPSSDELKRIMMLNGGAFEHYLYRKRVTHVIATNLPDSKISQLKGLKVVRPEWITDSIKAETLLPYTTYQLYTQQTQLQTGIENFTIVQPHTSPAEKNLPSNSGHIDQNVQSNRGLVVNSRSDISSHGKPGQEQSQINARLEFNKFVATRDTSATRVNISRQVTPPKTSSHASAREPQFLSEYYTNSRLHHLSTWKAEFREYVNHLQSTRGGIFPGRDKLTDVVQRRETTAVDSDLEASANLKRKCCVMHIDMDCFFVSVGLLNRPDLKGKPVAVTHSTGKGAPQAPGANVELERKLWEQKRLEGRKKQGKHKPPVSRSIEGDNDDLSFPDLSDSDSGVEDEQEVAMETGGDEEKISKDTLSFHSMAEIASCSYEARKAGVKNGMYMGKAVALCPDLKTIPYDFEEYQQVSKTLYDTVASYTHDIEAVSCDEMLVDCTDLLSITGATPLEFSTLLREEIFQKTRCNASAGLASNILLAKMATRKAKPNGQYNLKSDEVMTFIKPQSIGDIPGVGWSITKKFETLGVATCGDLQAVTMATLKKEFGPKTGQSLYQYCRGQDERPVKMEHQRKSVSAEVNYGIRFRMENEAVKFVQELAEEVCSRLQAINKKGRSVTLKLMIRREDAPKQTSKFMGHGICNNLSKSVMLPMATDNGKIVGKECINILRQQRAPVEDLRGIGIQIQKLESSDPGTGSSSKGKQSILNFTVSTAPKQVFPESKTDEGNHNKGLNNSNNSTSQHLNKVTSPESSTVAKVTDKLSRPDSNLDDDCSNSESDGEAQVEDEDGDVHIHEANFSEGIVADLARRKAGKMALPPLPQLNPVTTPEHHRTPILKSKSAAGSKTEDDYFPSPSQIDPAVLSELPDDIREQIEKELMSRRNKNSKSTSGQTVEAGCSHWRNNKGENSPSITKSPKSSHDEIVPLPSPSQLDMSCLSALPESLQSEIREAYARMESKSASDPSRRTTEKQLQLKQTGPSPSKISPNKRSPGKGRSPQFKVPRGRGAGRGRKRGTTKKSLFKDQTRVQKVPDEEQTVGREPADTGTSYYTSKDQEPEPEVATPGTNLCGAVTLPEVRDLIKEWICSTPAPQQEDEEVLLKYMQDLVLDRNLEQVDLLLKFMHRNILYVNNSDWLLSLKRIFCQTQVIVKSTYGSVLSSIRL